MEKAILPLRYLAITQGINEGSHLGTKTIDFGWCGSGEMETEEMLYTTDKNWTWKPVSKTIKIDQTGKYLCLYHGWISSLGSEMDLRFTINSKICIKQEVL